MQKGSDYPQAAWCKWGSNGSIGKLKIASPDNKRLSPELTLFNLLTLCKRGSLNPNCYRNTNPLSLTSLGSVEGVCSGDPLYLGGQGGVAQHLPGVDSLHAAPEHSLGRHLGTRTGVADVKQAACDRVRS